MHCSFHLQSESFAPWALTKGREFSSNDITAIISVRAHENNPWIARRLDLLAGFYHPAPRFLVVDFGSEPEFSKMIQDRCATHGFLYRRVEDKGVFSLSIARNAGASSAETDLLYFTDIDFFSAPDHFSRLATYASLHDFGIVRDIILNVPAYHLTEGTSAEFAGVPTAQRLKYIEQLGAISAEKSRDRLTEFIAPYSNNFAGFFPDRRGL
jgi:predicted glycosyltransferase involved in capsule biosynthesis